MVYDRDTNLAINIEQWSLLTLHSPLRTLRAKDSGSLGIPRL